MRTQALSAILLGGLLALSAAGQGNTVPRTTDVKKAATLEDDIARAVQSHPDVRVAEAEAQLANAKLQQTKQAVAQRVAAAKREKDRVASDLAMSRSKLEIVQRSVETVKLHFDRLQHLHKAGQAPASEIAIAQQELDKAKLGVLVAEQALATEKARLANAEAEYEAMAGKAIVKADAGDGSEPTADTARLTEYIRQFKVNLPKRGSVADKIRTALAKSIVFECKNSSIYSIVENFKKSAELEFMIRAAGIENEMMSFSKLELPLAAWLELIRDEMASRMKGEETKKIEWYIREYGLLLSANGRPDGALTLSEFLKAVREDTEKPKAEPKK